MKIDWGYLYTFYGVLLSVGGTAGLLQLLLFERPSGKVEP